MPHRCVAKIIASKAAERPLVVLFLSEFYMSWKSKLYRPILSTERHGQIFSVEKNVWFPYDVQHIEVERRPVIDDVAKSDHCTTVIPHYQLSFLLSLPVDAGQLRLNQWANMSQERIVLLRSVWNYEVKIASLQQHASTDAASDEPYATASKWASS